MNTTVLLIPHYNNPTGLLNSLKSIGVDQAIDILVVDDGSRQNRIDEALLNAAFRGQGEISYEYLPQNKGIEYALNRGLEIIQSRGYQWIARLDCGDICLGNRFRLQQEFLEQHPEVKIVGTNVTAADTEGKFLYHICMPETATEIANKMYFNSMLIHPTVMFSAEVLQTVGFYPTRYKWAEDYAFFFEIVQKHQAANIGQYLSQIEINDSGISISKRKIQVRSRIAVIRKHFYFGFYPIYGLLRNYILLYVPYKVIFFIKKFKR
ncbi:glycosyltransferase [Flavobacterium sp. CYK-4]|uniref:glycosyltransferase n=1 Tax=Flavobacterium lotistagni TaxID=2709660 RepID=UPI00140B95AF|nr:glycosyltransferase [Flavobacterium lotistagni]NHM07783.1 glycosyltransferase [Flavobacterium lotistagni]